MSAREEVLARIRSALADGAAVSDGAGASGGARASDGAAVPDGAGASGGAGPSDGAAVSRGARMAVPVPRDYRRAGQPADPELSRPEVLELLVDRLVDYRASVTRTAPDGVAAVLARRLAEHGIGSVLVPDGFPAEWLAASSAERRADDALTPDQLDRIDGVVCTCRLAIAETGTIVLDSGPGQGRRAVSLVPDYLLIVLRAGQVVAGVPEAVAELHPGRQPDGARPLTWISGPSATSDIELNRVEGVHGPRTLDVILIESESESQAGFEPEAGSGPEVEVQAEAS